MFLAASTIAAQWIADHHQHPQQTDGIWEQWYYKHLQGFFFISLPFSYQYANLLFKCMLLHCGCGLLISDLKMQHRLKAAGARTQLDYEKRVRTAKLTFLSKYHNGNKNNHIQAHAPGGYNREYTLIESIIWLAETARGHLNSCPKQEKLHQVAQGPIQLNFHYLQGWWLDNFSGNLFQLLISCGYMLTSASFWMSYTYRSVASILFYGFGFLLASPRMQQPLTSDWFSQCQRRTRMVTLKLEQGIYMHLN